MTGTDFFVALTTRVIRDTSTPSKPRNWVIHQQGAKEKKEEKEKRKKKEVIRSQANVCFSFLDRRHGVDLKNEVE